MNSPQCLLAFYLNFWLRLSSCFYSKATVWPPPIPQNDSKPSIICHSRRSYISHQGAASRFPIINFCCVKSSHLKLSYTLYQCTFGLVSTPSVGMEVCQEPCVIQTNAVDPSDHSWTKIVHSLRLFRIAWCRKRHEGTRLR